MPFSWLSMLDAAIGAVDIARRASRRRAHLDEPDALEVASPARRRRLDARLVGVVVAALKETFDRDSRRLEFEREQAELERQRAERALRLELARQAGEREIGRLRLLAGTAVASWLGTLVLAARFAGTSAPPRVVLAGGWVFLIAALACTFAGQSFVAHELERIGDGGGPGDAGDSGMAGALAPWLIVIGLALSGLAILVA